MGCANKYIFIRPNIHSLSLFFLHLLLLLVKHVLNVLHGRAVVFTLVIFMLLEPLQILYFYYEMVNCTNLGK